MTVCQGGSRFAKRARFTNGLDFATGRQPRPPRPPTFSRSAGGLCLRCLSFRVRAECCRFATQLPHTRRYGRTSLAAPNAELAPKSLTDRHAPALGGMAVAEFQDRCL